MSQPVKPADLAEIAAALGMKSKRGAEKRAARESWTYTETPGLGGQRRMYDLSALPKPIRTAVESHRLNRMVAAMPALAGPVSPQTPQVSSSLEGASALSAGAAPPVPAGVSLPVRAVKKLVDKSQWEDLDRTRAGAREALARAVMAVMADLHASPTRAARELGRRLSAGEADAALLAANRAACVKQRAGSMESASAIARRLERIYGDYLKGCRDGDPYRHLVPGRPRKTGHCPMTTRAVLRYWCLPARFNCGEVLRKITAELDHAGLPVPSLSTVQRIVKDLPERVKYRGRMTGSEYAARMPYISRDVSMFSANDIWVGDGHSFKALVRSKLTNRPYTPEVTVVMDWVSRRVVGWSVDVAESTLAVSAAFRHAQRNTRARPLVYYSDNGSGQTGKLIDADLTGTLFRQGIQHATGRPANPQGRGVIENAWQDHVIPLAKEYETCVWKGADGPTVNRTRKRLKNKDEGGIRVPEFEDFVADLDNAFAAYNARPHGALDGLSPDQAYAERLDQNSIVFAVGDTELDLLWMPEVLRVPTRGLVTVYNNEYLCKALVDAPTQEKVRVRFDIHDAHHVWLYTLNGLFLGTAVWNAHKVAAYPVPFIEKQRAARVAAQVKRHEAGIAEANLELGNTLDAVTYEVPEIPRPFGYDLPRAGDAEPVDAELVEDVSQEQWQQQLVVLYRPGKATKETGGEDEKPPSEEVPPPGGNRADGG